MDISLTPWLWLNLICAGFLFGVGFHLAGIVVSGVLGWFPRRPPP